MKTLLSILLLSALSIAVAQEKAAITTDQGLKVEKTVVATSVENRDPVGESKEFTASAGTLYCWTRILAQTPPATIKHVWYLGGEKVFEKELEVKYPTTRTWSAKSVKAGDWKVDVLDAAGTVLSSVTYTVKE